MEIGTAVIVGGITLRGKNRIQRGGHSWMVKKNGSGKMILLQSVQNEKELFWMSETNDRHNQLLNGKDVR